MAIRPISLAGAFALLSACSPAAEPLNLYAVGYLDGEVGATAGPLPYDEAECERRMDHFRQNAPAMTFECVWAVERPAMEVQDNE